MTETPILLWFRRDLRLADNPALAQAAGTGRPVIPVFLHDEVVERMGAAPRWRLGLAVAAFAQALEAQGSRLILRRGRAAELLPALAAELGAGGVLWSRLYDPDSVARDREVVAALEAAGLGWKSMPGHVLFEPDSVATGQGEPYKVYTPYWKAVRDRDPGACLPAPARLPAPGRWPDSERLEDWAMGQAMRRGADVVAQHVTVGEAAARDRLDGFLDEGIGEYHARRDLPGVDGTSGLSENLSYGEVSIRACWHGGWRALEAGKAGAETWLKELVWRDFAHHLAFHMPRLISANWREKWDAFPWNEDADRPEVRAWRQGRTGLAFVDAAQREMYVTGRMHNRARMIVASYLTKHLMTHWKIGLKWFEDCLVDWDPASNALGWQWVAGSGPDASPYFRVFNPESQLDKFDPKRAYTRRWIAEGQAEPPETALSYFAAIPESWSISPADPYPEPVVSAAEGRAHALAAYENRKF
jgi:deoxyribodipyrimidine photo-lyase